MSAQADGPLSGDGPGERVTWVDIVKGLTISLVVLAHAMSERPGDLYYVPALAGFNDTLRMVRMPLFFFVAGFFVDRSLALAWKPFIEKKLFLLLWLYVFWGMMRFLTSDVAVRLWHGMPVDPSSWLLMFVVPTPTLWFIYALLIVFFLSRCLRSVPIPILLGLACLAYSISIASGVLQALPLSSRIIRFLPFFLLGRMGGFAWVDARRWRVHRVHLLLVPAYFALAYLLLATPLRRVAPVTFAVTLIGMAGGLSAAILLSRGRYGRYVEFLGRHSIDVYAVHFLPVLLFKRLLQEMPFIDVSLRVLIIWVGSVLLSLVAGQVIRRLVGSWPFERPSWLVLPSVRALRPSRRIGWSE